MTKHEYLATSLPYQLWCKILDYKNDYVGHPFDLIVGMTQWSKDGKLWSLRTLGGAKPSFERVMPICRPLFDLTKPIEHKGENFVPIIELANICYNNIFKTNPTIKECETLFDDESFGFIGYTDEERISLTYVDDFNRNEFEFWISKNKMNIQQPALFQKLIEWHFDVADLISKGEAIDVNTLEINPYK